MTQLNEPDFGTPGSDSAQTVSLEVDGVAVSGLYHQGLPTAGLLWIIFHADNLRVNDPVVERAAHHLEA